MPATAMASNKHPSHFNKQHRNSSKSSLHSRSSSSSKLYQGHGRNLAFTTIKPAPEAPTPKRVDSSQTIRTEGAPRDHHPNRPPMTARQSSRVVSQASIKKPKFNMPDEIHDVKVTDEHPTTYDRAEDEDDDDENWVSSGVATPDDREEVDNAENTTPQAEAPPPGLGFAAPPAAIPSRPSPPPQSDPVVAGPSSVPTYDTSTLEQRELDADAGVDHYRHVHDGGYKTAPSSRPPSVHNRRRRDPPSLIRTSSFTPTLHTTAPPLMTSSIANAQMTSTNPPDEEEEAALTPPANASPVHRYGHNFGPRRSSPPASPQSVRITSSRSAFLPAKDASSSAASISAFRPPFMRNSTASSVSTLAASRSPAHISPNHSVNNSNAAPPVESAVSRFSNSQAAKDEPPSRKGSAFSIASGTISAAASGVAGLFGRGSTSAFSNVGSPLNSEHPNHRDSYHSHTSRPSAAMSSLQAIPKHRDSTAPAPLTSHFPPDSQLAGVGGQQHKAIAFSLLPAPYMAAHMAVRAYEAPLQDSYERVVRTRMRSLATGAAGGGNGRAR